MSSARLTTCWRGPPIPDLRGPRSRSYRELVFDGETHGRRRTMETMTTYVTTAGTPQRVSKGGVHRTGERGLVCFSSVGGTMGDVRPMIPLALALRARGFDIVFIGDLTYQSLALEAGIAPSEWFTYSLVPQAFWLRTT